MRKISIEHVSKVFGPDPASVLPLIEQGLSKSEILARTGHVVGIRDVSLEVEAGEVFVVMGLSGSGKSTLIRHINRLIEPTAGRILIDGEDVLELDDAALLELRRHRISMVFQRFGLLPHRTVVDNVAYGLVISGMPRREARERARRQIELVGLAGFEERYPRQLSGGMQQRVGLARALATDAEILLMDEAFSALDPLIRDDMQLQLKELQKNLHKTIVFITHDLDEALRLGDHIAILRDGELRQIGRPVEILTRPADDYVARFVRNVNRLRAMRLGELATAVPVVEVSEFSLPHCRKALAAHPAVVVLKGGAPRTVVTRELLEPHGEGGEDGWRGLDSLPRASTVGADLTLEDGLALIPEDGRPIVVVTDEGAILGIVTAFDVIRALRGESSATPEAEGDREQAAGGEGGGRGWD